uniref:Uncharacterized protein n=1 Tax=Arundo donax TaxID=35708 RepID=A0A0A8Y7I3_ARUDO
MLTSWCKFPMHDKCGISNLIFQTYVTTLNLVVQ